MSALEQFEAVESNLGKLERLWRELESLMPAGIQFGPNPEYEDRSRAFAGLLQSLPNIDGWKPSATPPDLDDLAQNRFDALELMEPSAQVSIERWAEEPGRELHEYRYRLNSARRALIRDALISIIDLMDSHFRVLREAAKGLEHNEKIESPAWESIRELISQIEVLLGSSVAKPPRWSDFRRHVSFAMVADLQDIEQFDWPQVKGALRKGLYGENDPLPVKVNDLSDLIAAKPSGPIATKLAWSNLNDDDFERLLFALIGTEVGYENPEWLMQTRAPDRGRDLSVTRVSVDKLSGTRRQRIVIQCKHWLRNSVSVADVSSTKDQLAFWRDPPVDELIIATSGRFSADAVAWVEQHNQKHGIPRIEIWAESHLERLLAARPFLIAEFHLRQQ